MTSFAGYNLDDWVTLIEDEEAPFPYVVVERGYRTSPYGSRAGGVATFTPPGVRVTPMGGIIKAAIGTGAFRTALDNLLRALGQPRRRLIVTPTADRFSLASFRSATTQLVGINGRWGGEFIGEDAYEANVIPSADVRTPTLALLPEGVPVYGVRFSLTPGGSAPALPRILAVNQVAGVTPIAWRVTNLATGVAIATSASVPAVSLLRFDRRGAFVSDQALVLGYWPLCDAVTPFRDFSGNGRDLTAFAGGGSLTLSGNEITDALRTTNTEGDGYTGSDSSMGIWEATTNVHANGGAETNTTGWTARASTTMTRDTARAKFGAASLKCAITGSGGGANYAITLAASTQYSLSFWVYADGANHSIDSTLTDGIDQSLAMAGGTATNGVWTKFSAQGTTDTHTARTLEILSNNASGTFFIDGVQLETKPIATPYKHTDGGTAARSAARVQWPATYVDETVGGMAFRVSPGWLNTARTGANPVLWQWKDDANNLLELRYDVANARWEFQRRNGGGTAEVTVADTFAADADITVIATWDASNIKLSVDGAAFTSQAGANIPTLAATLSDIGSSAGTAEHFDGRVRWAASYTTLLTDGNATSLHGFGNTDPTFGTLPGTPTALWTGVTNALETGGAVSAVTFLQDGPDAPPDGVAMDAAAAFDGSANGYADSSVSQLGATGSITLMGWVYLTNVTGTKVFASKASTNNGYSVGLAGGVFRGQAGNATAPKTLDGYTVAQVSKWYFVAFQATSTRTRLWLGDLDLPPRLEDQDTGLALTAGTNNFRVGAGHQVSDGVAYPAVCRPSEWMLVNAELNQSQLEAAWLVGPPGWNEVAVDYEGAVPELVPRPLTTNVIELQATHATVAPTPRLAIIHRARWE